MKRSVYLVRSSSCQPLIRLAAVVLRFSLFEENVEELTGISDPPSMVVPTQLLVAYLLTWRGLDVDKPRNLAKSVTVK